MRLRPLLLVVTALAALALGCSGGRPPVHTGAAPATETGAGDTDAPVDTASDTDPDTDIPPVDRDADGAVEGVDCDDTDPTAYPGATEAWDDVDDDCDGVVDGDGAWSGAIRVRASAVYEGDRYDYDLTCPFTGTRALGQLAFAITCTPDPADPQAQLLLGATLTITPDDPDVTGDRWEDGVVFTSSNGWDSDGDGVIAWSGFSAADVEVTMRGVSLQASGSGGIARE